MPVNPIYGAYADVTAFREYLAGTSYSAAWTSDAAAILRILESASRTMEQSIGGRSWAPRVETRVYDLGSGGLRNNRLLDTRQSYHRPDYWPGNLGGRGVVMLDDWLLAATAVTAYSDTSRTTTQTLTAGIAADYLLEPYNESPKHTLKLTEITAKTLGAGQQTLSIAGTWGWQNVTTAITTLGAAISSTTATSVTVASGAPCAVGQTLVIDSEQLYVTGVATNTLTVVRGVNGTTAATHSNGQAVSRIDHPADLTQICLEIARNRWKERDAGVGDMLGASAGNVGQFQISRPGAEDRALLQRLKVYLGRREGGGVFL